MLGAEVRAKAFDRSRSLTASCFPCSNSVLSPARAELPPPEEKPLTIH